MIDFEIRNATQNKKSLDDVMRLLYWKYYMKEHRGFTDAEFQETCEIVAGIPLTRVFEYVYTTKELDYNTYLNFAGLKLAKQDIDTSDKQKTQKLMINRKENPSPLQLSILNSWLGE
jgi:predicted metalloprotease with PDZ domain